MLLRRDAAGYRQGPPRLRYPLPERRCAPPGLLVRDEADHGFVLLLVGQAGNKLDSDIELAARVLAVRGDLELHSGTPVLRVRSWELRK